MTYNKDTERVEFHKTIWKVANDLRGTIDGWDFKNYVPGILFYRFISENLTSYINKLEQKSGIDDFDYAKLKDEEAEFGREETVKEKGCYILPSELFNNINAKADNDPDLNVTLSNEFSRSGNKNKLLDENIKRILDAFKARQDSEYFAKLVHNEKIAENDYNIALSTYVQQKDDRVEIDITQLDADIEQIVARQSELRSQIDAIVRDLEG